MRSDLAPISGFSMSDSGLFRPRQPYAGLKRTPSRHALAVLARPRSHLNRLILYAMFAVVMAVLARAQADGSDRQPHPSLLVGENMLNLRPVLRFAPVGLRGRSAHRTLVRLLAVDAAVQPVLLEPLLVLRRAVPPVFHVAGVAGVGQTFANPLDVIRGGGRHDLAADNPVHLFDADVDLLAVDRNGDVDWLPDVRLGLRLFVLDRPARFRVLLRRLGRRVRPRRPKS